MPEHRNTEAKRAKVRFPDDADSNELEAQLEEATAALRERHRNDHQLVLRRAEEEGQGSSAVADEVGLDREHLEEKTKPLFEQRRKLLETGIDRHRSDPPDVPEGHNPVRYHPFDAARHAIDCGGLNFCQLYTVREGQLREGSQLGAYLSAVGGGGGSASSEVMVWAWAPSSGTMLVTATAEVWGDASAYSYLAGYAAAYASLRLKVWDPNAARLHEATTDVANYHRWVGQDHIGFARPQRRFVSIALPVRSGSFYQLWVGGSQSVAAGGIAEAASTIAMFIGPISWTFS